MMVEMILDICYNQFTEGGMHMTYENRTAPAQEHTLVCLSASPSNAKIIQTAARMASAFGGSFTALYVQTPAFEKM